MIQYSDIKLEKHDGYENSTPADTIEFHGNDFIKLESLKNEPNNENHEQEITDLVDEDIRDINNYCEIKIEEQYVKTEFCDYEDNNISENLNENNESKFIIF